MARGPRKGKDSKQVSTLTHEGAARKNIPTAEYQSVAERLEEIQPVGPVHYKRRTPLAVGETRERDEDLDPQIIWRGMRIRLSKEQARQLSDKGEVDIGEAQLVWKGKDRQDWSDLVAPTPQIYIQEKVHPKAIIDDLVRRTKSAAAEKDEAPDLFADFNGLNDPEARTEFYQHDQHWSNRMILGDSLAVMASLTEREALRGKVQCIYFDPPYGIKFNSNWQVSTQSRDVKDGKQADISREPEQVKAFRDTWKDEIHSYLTYLRDRLTVARDLLTDSGSIFVQIGDENVHRVRAVMDEVFGDRNFINCIPFVTTGGQSNTGLAKVFDLVLWYAKSVDTIKYRQLYEFRELRAGGGWAHSRVKISDGSKLNLGKDDVKRRVEAGEEVDPYYQDNLASQGGTPEGSKPLKFQGKWYSPPANSHWKTHTVGLVRLARSGRIDASENSVRYVRLFSDFRIEPITNIWSDTIRAGYIDQKRYVVETMPKVIERCIQMTTDVGDLVLDPTCGSGTSAYVSEQWGRRWITIDTSRVALALARTRLMSARYPYYLLADTPTGRHREQEVSGKIQPNAPTLGDLRQGFVYNRVPHIMLNKIANNSQIDDIWLKWQSNLEPIRDELNSMLAQVWEEWEIPRDTIDKWPDKAKAAHKAWWEARIARQKEIDASIAKAADVELLYDRPYEDKSRVRVAGPFTVESLSPHRVMHSNDEELIDEWDAADGKRARIMAAAPPSDFAAMVLEHLRSVGVHQSEKRDTIRFTSLQPWPGVYIGGKGVFLEGDIARQAGIFIGPEFGTMSRVDLVAAAREATDARVDVLIACAFNFDAHASELTKLGPLPILKAKMNPDLHMAEDLKNTGKGNLFVVFGEPDFDVRTERDGKLVVKVNGIDVFDPNTGEIRSGDTKSIAAWFIDTDYNEESFFVRHAYFLGANDPYKSLKTALQAEIDRDAWETLYRDESHPFARPETGKIAVKIINHFGDEVMKVFRV